MILVIFTIPSLGGTSQTRMINSIRVVRLDLGEGVANCYVVNDVNRDAYVIDPGGKATEIVEYLQKERLKKYSGTS